MNDVQHSFHARILFLCDAVLAANGLTDLLVLKNRAHAIACEIDERRLGTTPVVEDGRDLI